jgi:hypothetical protein
MKMMMKWTLSDLDNVCQENLWPVATHWQTLSHNVVSSTPKEEFLS